jgi:hypothetical protein
MADVNRWVVANQDWIRIAIKDNKEIRKERQEGERKEEQEQEGESETIEHMLGSSQKSSLPVNPDDAELEEALRIAECYKLDLELSTKSMASADAGSTTNLSALGTTYATEAKSDDVVDTSGVAINPALPCAHMLDNGKLCVDPTESYIDEDLAGSFAFGQDSEDEDL